MATLLLALAACDESDDGSEAPNGGDVSDNGDDAGDAGVGDTAVGGDADLGAPDADAAAEVGAAAPGEVTGTVDYDGESTGNLLVGLFTSDPPMGPPVAFTTIESVTWPATFTFTVGDEGGDHNVVAIFDVGADNPAIPGPEDLMGSYAQNPIMLDAGAGVSGIEILIAE